MSKRKYSTRKEIKDFLYSLNNDFLPTKTFLINTGKRIVKTQFKLPRNLCNISLHETGRGYKIEKNVCNYLHYIFFIYFLYIFYIFFILNE